MTYMRVPGIDRKEDRFKSEIDVTNTKRADAEIDQKRAQPPMARQPDSDKEGTPLDKVLAALDALNRRMDKWEEARQAEREEEREADTAGLLPSEKEREEREIKPPEGRSDSYESFRNYPIREYDSEAQFRLRDAQARADAVAQLFGERAPQPVTGEDLHEYRMRLLRPWQRYSPYKNADLAKIGDAKAFDAIEAQIYADASKASEDPDAPPGQLRMITKVDEHGRKINTWHGRGTFIGMMKPASRKVLGFTTKPELR